MQVKLKDLKGDCTHYKLTKGGEFVMLASGDFIYKILTHPKVAPLWGVDSEKTEVDVTCAGW